MKYTLRFFLVFTINLGAAQNDEEITIAIDRLLEHWDPEAPSVSVAVVHKSEIKYLKSRGLANLEYEIKATDTVRYHVASLAKQFTAYVVLSLEGDGKLSLEDDVRKYIPEMPDMGFRIALKHLLTHTSGIRDQWDAMIIAGVRPDDVITQEHVLSFVRHQKELNFEPGSEYLYSNTGYTLLAEVVARVSGQSFADFTQEYIFDPLEMKNSFFLDDHERIVKNRAYSYYKRDNSYRKRSLNYATVGPTNMLTSTQDMAKWMMHLQSPGAARSSIIEKMTTLARLNNGESFGGGMGLFVNDRNGIKELEHSGADAGFRAQMRWFPSYELGVVVLSNNATVDARSLAAQIADMYLLRHDQANDALDRNAELPAKVKLDPKEAQAFTGYYWNKKHAFTRRIYLKNDTLMHFRTENNESPLEALSDGTFKVSNVPVHAIVKFVEKPNGAYQLIETVNEGRPKILERYVNMEYDLDDWLAYEGSYYSDELKTVYSIKFEDGKLVAHHIRMGDITLDKVKHNFFKADRGFLGTVEFVRNELDEVEGFTITNGRVRALLFTRVE